MLNRALKIIRVFAGLTQVEAAEKLILSQSYVSEIERGAKVPTLDVLQRYSEFFEIPISTIMLFSENLDKGGVQAKAQKMVTTKVIDLLEFIQKKGSSNGEEL